MQPVEIYEQKRVLAASELEAMAGALLERLGASFSFEASDIHRVEHWGNEPAVTLHVYSPPLARMGAYSVGKNGVLARHSGSYTEELKPLAPEAARAA